MPWPPYPTLSMGKATPIAPFASVMRRQGKPKSLACGRARVSDAGHHLRRIRGKSSVNSTPGPASGITRSLVPNVLGSASVSAIPPQ